MKKQDTKPHVAPPASYKAPSLPTLAALGILTATAFTTGCGDKKFPGLPIEPKEDKITTPTLPERDRGRTLGIIVSPQFHNPDTPKPSEPEVKGIAP